MSFLDVIASPPTVEDVTPPVDVGWPFAIALAALVIAVVILLIIRGRKK